MICYEITGKINKGCFRLFILLFVLAFVAVVSICVYFIDKTFGPFNSGSDNENGSLSSAKNRLLVPLYIFPDPAIYTKVGNVADDVIINPNNGLDATSSPTLQWIESLDLACNSRTTCYGYVPSGYGQRDLSLIKAEINGYKQFWSKWIKGVFIDESKSSEFDFYNEIAQTASLNGFDVILNTGLTVPKTDEKIFTIPGLKAIVQWENSLLPEEILEPFERSGIIVHGQSNLDNLTATKAKAKYFYYCENDLYHQSLPAYFDKLKV